MSKTIKMHGLNIPRPLIFIHGFVDGRFKGATIDQDSNLLNSAYVHGKLFQYNEFCKKSITKLERELSAVRIEAEIKIEELENIQIPEIIDSQIEVLKYDASKIPDSVSEAQVYRAAAKRVAKASEAETQSRQKHDEALKKRQEIICRLIEIKNRINTREHNANRELGAVADNLKSCISVYCHGVILRPVYSRYIPIIEYTNYLENYRKEHEELNCKIADVLKKEVK